MTNDEEQPSVAGEPEMLSDGSEEFLGVMGFSLIVAIVTGGLCVAAMVVVIHLLEVWGYV